jgi:hypothetical protein
MEQNKEQAMRFNNGKLPWNLVDLPSFEPMVRVLEFGAKKYAPNNWKKGMPITEIYDSLMRHMIALMSGEDNDPESGLPHIGHIQCNVMFMAHVLKNHPEFDDRELSPEETKKFMDMLVIKGGLSDPNQLA